MIQPITIITGYHNLMILVFVVEEKLISTKQIGISKLSNFEILATTR